MNRQLEVSQGVGYGRVSKDSQKNLEIGEQLCQKGQPEKAVPYLTKAMEDEYNLDAFIQAAFLSPTLGEAIKALEFAEQRGRKLLRRHLGADCFHDTGAYAERFWAVLETRPYMRVLQALVRITQQNGQPAKAADTIIRMLRLCPGDNLGQRSWLGSMLLQAGRVADALAFAQAWLDPRTDFGADWPPRGGTEFRAPSRTPLLPAREAALTGHCDGAIAYTAALAAFKLLGDGKLAGQYLRIAAASNPAILMRILGRVTRPTELNMHARQFNGSEDAHDYLYLTQNLWMEPDVWAWADANQEGKRSVLKACSRAGCANAEHEAAEFKRCAACKQASYCGPECQKLDWKAHKPQCTAHNDIKRASRAFTAGKRVPANSDGKVPIVASMDMGSW